MDSTEIAYNAKPKLTMKEIKTKAEGEIELVLDCIDNINSADSPDGFFKNLDIMFKRLKHLTLLDSFVKIKNQTPSEFLNEVKSNKGKYINNFIDRYCDEIIYKIGKASKKGEKAEIYEGFVSSFSPFQNELGRSGRNYLKIKAAYVINEIEPGSVFVTDNPYPVIDVETKKAVKKSPVLLITACLGTLCALWGILVKTNIIPPEFLHSGFSGVYTVLFMSSITIPHILLIFLAAIFNYIAYFFRKKSFALASGCLYAVSFIVGAGYILLLAAVIILSFIGYSKIASSESYLSI